MNPDNDMITDMMQSLEKLRAPYLAEIAELQDLAGYEGCEEAWAALAALKAELKLLHELVGALTTSLVER